jgi:hypothetical protein
VTLSNIRVESEEAGKAEWAGRSVPEQGKAYPEARMFGRLPAYGFYCRHVQGLRLRQIELTATPDEGRPAIVCDDVTDLEIQGLRAAPVAGNQSTVKLAQTRQAFLHDCWAPAGTRAFLEVQGAKSEQIVASQNNLLTAQKVLEASADVPAGAVVLSGNVTRG